MSANSLLVSMTWVMRPVLRKGSRVTVG